LNLIIGFAFFLILLQTVALPLFCTRGWLEKDLALIEEAKQKGEKAESLLPRLRSPRGYSVRWQMGSGQTAERSYRIHSPLKRPSDKDGRPARAASADLIYDTGGDSHATVYLEFDEEERLKSFTTSSVG